MHQLPKRCLYLSSFLLLLCFASCKISKYKHKSCSEVALTEQVLTPIIKPNQPLKYKATIDVLKNHLSGILIVKQTDSVTTHFVFVTELGMKMFDFSYANNKMNAEFVFDPLNKPKLISSLMRNFEYMFLLNAMNKQACDDGNRIIHLTDGIINSYYTGYDTDNNAIDLKSQEVFNKKKRSVKIDYVYKRTIIDTLKTKDASHFIYNNYSHISCKQYGLIKIYIDLIAIQ